MKFQPVKGTRDFYPDEMRLRNWIFDAWRRVSLRNGFEEYDAPIFEHLDLFTVKSGQEIAEQLFSFTDRGGRNLAIRPEITPSLARMVGEKVNSLPRPIKWFSIPRLCRAEKPQRGRLREFFQWNVDVIGEQSVLADAECVFVLVDFLREIGLTPQDVVVRYSSRDLLSATMAHFGVVDEQAQCVMAVLDKRGKVAQDDFEKMLTEVLPNDHARTGIMALLDAPDALDASQPSGRADEAATNLRAFREYLESFGIADWCEYDTSIVRGLAYYTGIVYEVFGRGESLRAVAGGGRYDNLLELVGGPKTPATGFGMGDVVLEILLIQKGKLPRLSAALDFFVIDAQEGALASVLKAVGGLRSMGFSADYSYARRSIGKQLKEANRRGARRAVIVRQDGVGVKDLASGEQRDMSLDEFLAELGGGAGPGPDR